MSLAPRGRFHLALCLLLTAPLVGDTARAAAPKKPSTSRSTQPPRASRSPDDGGKKTDSKRRKKAVGPHVFTKRGLPAIKMSKAPALPIGDVAPEAPSAAWTPPPGEPFDGELEFDSLHVVAGPGRLYGSYASFNQSLSEPSGPFNFNYPYSSIGIMLPTTAVGDSDLVFKCKGSFPGDLWATLTVFDGQQSKAMLLMQFPNATSSVAFIVVADQMPQNGMVRIGLTHSDYAMWSVDRCTLERV
jgi:hypothetical protein